LGADLASLLMLNGPNLDLLGQREPGVYGRITLAQIEADSKKLAAECGHQLVCFQSNAEHELVDRIHQAAHEGIEFILINPAAFTHTSVALRDALLGVGIPFIEIHLSNVQARETFRHASYFSDIARGTITGLGPVGYELAIRAVSSLLGSTDTD